MSYCGVIFPELLAEEGHEDDQKAGAPPFEDRLRDLGLLSLEKAPGRPDSGLSVPKGGL